MRYVIDCRKKDSQVNNFLELGLWGKPCFAWTIETAMSAGGDMFIVLTNSPFIKDYCDEHYPDVEVLGHLSSYDGTTFFISGYAPCLSAETLRGALEQFAHVEQDLCMLVSAADASVYKRENGIIPVYNGTQLEMNNAFSIYRENGDKGQLLYPVPASEMAVINSTNEFELALVLKKKQESKAILEQMIDKIIADKKETLSHKLKDKTICLVGHSQLDQWSITELGGYQVRNCGVSGISSFEYDKKILQKELLNCEADVFLVMHGTNDIVYEYTLPQIMQSIWQTIAYIRKHNNQARILFLACAHVNGRLDRNNDVIDKLNELLRRELAGYVEWLDTTFLDDKYSHLKESYTKDGLHFNETGYVAIRHAVEKKLKEMNL